mgnify:CR=1 FL=1
MNYSFKASLAIVYLVSQFALANNAELTLKKGETVKNSPLLVTPSNSSDSIKVLPPKQSVNVYERQRAWYRVTTSDMFEGWIKMLNLRLLGRMKREGELGVVTLLDSVNPMKTSPTKSTGIRGFDEEDLMNAQANLEQVAQLENYTITDSELKRFIANGQLSIRKVADEEEEHTDD